MRRTGIGRVGHNRVGARDTDGDAAKLRDQLHSGIALPTRLQTPAKSALLSNAVRTHRQPAPEQRVASEDVRWAVEVLDRGGPGDLAAEDDG